MIEIELFLEAPDPETGEIKQFDRGPLTMEVEAVPRQGEAIIIDVEVVPFEREGKTITGGEYEFLVTKVTHRIAETCSIFVEARSLPPWQGGGVPAFSKWIAVAGVEEL